MILIVETTQVFLMFLLLMVIIFLARAFYEMLVVYRSAIAMRPWPSLQEISATRYPCYIKYRDISSLPTAAIRFARMQGISNAKVQVNACISSYMSQAEELAESRQCSTA